VRSSTGKKLCYLEKINIEIIDIDDTNALHFCLLRYEFLSPEGTLRIFLYVTLAVDKDLAL
jgi:hypothetical protein